MTPRRPTRVALILTGTLVLGLGLAFSSLGFAQTTTPTDQKKEMESCCAMASASRALRAQP